jgi:hypothetical protein
MLQPHFPELQPILDKVEELRDYSAVHLVLVFFEELIAAASTPAMAQTACERIASMCNSKAWGDFDASGFRSKWTDWQQFLGELGEIAVDCR